MTSDLLFSCSNVNFHYPSQWTISGLVRRTRPSSSELPKVLDDVTLTISHGDRLGLIGRNGAGKSTLLRIISGIYAPDTGSVQISGKVRALLDKGFGLQDQLSGGANARTQAIMEGLRGDDIDAYVREVEGITDIGKAFWEPVYSYSSGMRTRLVFGLSVSQSPALLVLDELLSTGDEKFQAGAKNMLDDMLSQSAGLVCSTHSLSFLREECTSLVVMQHGAIAFHGAVEEGIEFYVNG